MMNEITVNGKSVSIRREGNALWVRLNDVIALLGEKKRPVEWLRTKRSQACLSRISEKLGKPADELIKTIHGGTNEQKGTWCSHSVILIEVLEWCSVYAQFAKDHMVYLALNGKTRKEAEEDLKNSHPAAYAFASLLNRLGDVYSETSFFAPLEPERETMVFDGRLFELVKENPSDEEIEALNARFPQGVLYMDCKLYLDILYVGLYKKEG